MQDELLPESPWCGGWWMAGMEEFFFSVASPGDRKWELRPPPSPGGGGRQAELIVILS